MVCFFVVFYVGISEQMCVDRGCCYREGANPSCFFPNVGMAEVKKVHVIHGCHFDAGFVDNTVNIVNRYFDEIYLRIYNVSSLYYCYHQEGKRYEQEGTNVQMKFTTQAWLLSLFYDCPKGLGIHCPTEVVDCMHCDVGSY